MKTETETLKDLVPHAYTNQKILGCALSITSTPDEAQELIQETVFYLIEKPRPFSYITFNHFVRFFILTMKRKKYNQDRNPRRKTTYLQPEHLEGFIQQQHLESPEKETETKDLIEKALHLYKKENVKTVLYAYFFKGLNTREISLEYGINVNTVSQRLCRGYRDLRNIIEQGNMI